MKFNKNELLSQNPIKYSLRLRGLFNMKTLILYFLVLNIFTQLKSINSLDNKDSFNDLNLDDFDNKEDSQKRDKLRSCTYLIKVRLSKDLEIVKDVILNFMESYQIKKEEALNKLKSFLTLSCLYNMIPEYSEEILNNKSLLDIDSMKPEYIKILELEEWFELHKKVDYNRIKEKVNFLKIQFNKYKGEEVKNSSFKGLVAFGVDLANLSYEVKLVITLIVVSLLIVLFWFLFSMISQEKKQKKKKN